ncbi:hypothetical protein CsatA_030656 [Cannabis sativa]
MKHRKLFPSPDGSTNGTECTDFCDPFFGYYYTQPPPPPPPPLTSSLSVTHQINDESHDISPSVIVLVTLFASLLLLLGYYVVVSKSCLGLCRARRNNNYEEEEEALPPSQLDGGDEEFIDGNHQHHPIWFITTVGLQQSIINSITVCRYRKGEGLIEGTDCSVCLNEFREDETLRLLPKCSHAFHIPCIDTWLRSHTNCPLCRAHIVNEGSVSTMAGGPVNQNQEISVNTEETQMGNSDVHSQMSENRVRVGAEEDDVDDNEGDCDDQLKDNPEIAMEDSERRVVKRSVSMDSSLIAENFERSDCAVNLKQEDDDDDDCSSSMVDNGLLKRHPSMSYGLSISPVVMKRSYSCGGRFLPSKRNQRPNSILPL